MCEGRLVLEEARSGDETVRFGVGDGNGTEYLRKAAGSKGGLRRFQFELREPARRV